MFEADLRGHASPEAFEGLAWSCFWLDIDTPPRFDTPLADQPHEVDRLFQARAEVCHLFHERRDPYGAARHQTARAKTPLPPISGSSDRLGLRTVPDQDRDPPAAAGSAFAPTPIVDRSSEHGPAAVGSRGLSVAGTWRQERNCGRNAGW